MTQAELGQRLNYSDKSISKWERGEAIPDAFVLTQMAELFGVTVDYLLCREDKRFLNISALSDQEAAVVCGMVEILKKKNGFSV